MKQITTVGLDLGKYVFHVVGCDSQGKIVGKKMLRRKQVLNYFVQLPTCLVAMEACASAHSMPLS
jgi:transposase